MRVVVRPLAFTRKVALPISVMSSRRFQRNVTKPPPAPSSGAAAASLLLLLLLAGGWVGPAEAVLPTGELRLSDGGTAYAAPAWFGLQLPEEDGAEYLPLRRPSGDADGCGDVTVADAPADGGGFVLLVERGNCFFDVKALAAQEAGAKGLVVMNSVEGIYQVCVTDFETRLDKGLD